MKNVRRITQKAIARNSFGNLLDAMMGARTFTYSYPAAVPQNPMPASMTRPNGAKAAYQFDAMKRLTEINNKNNALATIVEDDFTYPPTNPLPQNPDYIQTETVTGADITFTGGNISYTNNNNNQLTNISNLGNYVYDADGNMTTGYTPDGRQFTAAYDYENRLTSISCTDGSHSATFTYDANGYVADQKIDGGETRFVRDGYTVLQERDGSNSIQRSYLWNPGAPGGIGGLLEMKSYTDNKYYDYLYDGKGNVSAVVDDSNNIVASYAYDPFGNLVYSPIQTLNQPYMFSTKPYLSAFGLYYYGLRFYSPPAGTWLTMDPIGEKGGFNYYQFAGNNAVNNVDPFGLFQINIFGVVKINASFLTQDINVNFNLAPTMTMASTPEQQQQLNVDWANYKALRNAGETCTSPINQPTDTDVEIDKWLYSAAVGAVVTVATENLKLGGLYFGVTKSALDLTTDSPTDIPGEPVWLMPLVPPGIINPQPLDDDAYGDDGSNGEGTD